MKSDLTCPVEIEAVRLRTLDQAGNVTGVQPDREDAQLLCLITFFNLSSRVIDSLQMNIICYDETGARIGGRLVRAAALGGARERFEGRFMPDHAQGAVRVEASVEKVWFQNGVIWRREERNVQEYTPNDLPHGRELDLLRRAAGSDAKGYPQAGEKVWMCVCGRANAADADTCMRCLRTRKDVFEQYTYAVIDATWGERERMLEAQTRENLRRSSEQTAREMAEAERRMKRRRRRFALAIALLVLTAGTLAALRWGVPMGMMAYAQYRMDSGQAADARDLYAQVETYWPGFGAGEKAAEAERVIIRRMIEHGTAQTLAEAESRAKAIGDDALALEALLGRADLLRGAGDYEGALALLTPCTQPEAVKQREAILYEQADAAQKRVDYEAAIAAYAALSAYPDAVQKQTECIYMYGMQLQREGKYEAACEQFMRVYDHADAMAQLRRSRYALARQKDEAGLYDEAAALYESLGVYEQAQTKGQACRYRLGMQALGEGKLETAAAQLKMAGTYEDAAQRFADAATTLGMQLLAEERYEEALIWLEAVEDDADVGDALLLAGYGYAGRLEEAGRADEAANQYRKLGDYEDAQERAQAILYDAAAAQMKDDPHGAMLRFEELGDYKDARGQMNACALKLADADYAAGRYEEALNAYLTLGDYADAAAGARRSRYALAAALSKAGRYAEAAEHYRLCGAYADAEERAMQADYAQADLYEQAGDYEAAIAAYAALGSYEDAKLRITACEDAWLQDTYNHAVLDSAVGDYERVIAALGPYRGRDDLPERYAALTQLYETACYERAKLLIDLNRPLDALPLLEEVQDSKRAQKLLDGYVYRIVGRWKDKNGVEYLFRRDGSCRIAGTEGYFGGSGYEITLGETPYPTAAAYRVVNLRNGSLTLQEAQSGSTLRLTYLDAGEQAEPEQKEEERKE